MTTAIAEHAHGFFAGRLARWFAMADENAALTEVMFQDGETVLDISGTLVVDEISDLTDDAVRGLALQAAVYADEVFNRDSPFLSVMIEGGWRVSFSRPPLTPRGLVMSLRKLMRTALPLQSYVDDGIMTASQAEHLKQLVRTRRSVVISGGTGSGKTTLLRCLLEQVDRRQRIVTLEAPCELQLTNEAGTGPRRHWVALEAQPNGMQLDACLRAALRLRPDRIVVGEVRGPEALELLRSANTGHRGVLTTVHSNGAEECIDRLYSLCVEAQPTFPRDVVAKSIDAVVQISGMGRERRIDEIWESSR